MGILQRLFPAKTAITSETIKAEIDYSESEIKRLQAEISPKFASIATMTDAEHVKMETDIAATKRAIKRLDARIAHLQSELPAIIEAEKRLRQQPRTKPCAIVPKIAGRRTPSRASLS